MPPHFRTLIVVLSLLLGASGTAHAQTMDLQVGAGANWGKYYWAVPGAAGKVSFWRTFAPNTAWFVRAGGAVAVVDNDNTTARNYMATLQLGIRQWLGARRYGFAELGAQGAIVVSRETQDLIALGEVVNKEVELAADVLTFSVGMALGERRNYDLGFQVGWGPIASGALWLRVPLWHRN